MFDRVVGSVRAHATNGLSRARRVRGRDGGEPWPPHVEGDKWFYDHFDTAATDIIQFFAADGIRLEGLSIADVGCGDGIIDLGLVLKARPAHLVGYDINETDVGNLLEQARKRRVVKTLPLNLEFVKSATASIPAADASYDAVLTWSAFEHVADPTALLREMQRILKPDGKLFLQLWPFYYSEHGGHLWEWFPDESFVALRYSAEEIATRMRRDPRGDVDWMERRLDDFLTLNRITLSDLQRALGDAGFTVVKIELLTNAVHLPDGIARTFALTDLLTAGVKLLAAPFKP